jgi:AcrR family transcriptional regulator
MSTMSERVAEPSSPSLPTGRGRGAVTRARLVDVTIHLLAELGHAHVTVQRVCEATGVSNGALFRHFATREDLLVLAAATLAERVVEGFAADRYAMVDALNEGHPLVPLVEHLRNFARSETGSAWREIILAARHSQKLAEVLAEPVGRINLRTLAYIVEATGADPNHPATHEAVVMVLSIVHTLNSEAMFAFIETPSIAATRLEWLAQQLGEALVLAASTRQGAP